MSLIETRPAVSEPITATGFLDRVNPVTLFAAAITYSIPMLLTIDIVSALVALGAVLVLFALLRIHPIRIVKRAWPLFVAAPISAISMLLYAKPGGESHFRFLLANITDNSISLAIAIGLRVLAIGLPTLVVLGNIDPTRLADGLAQTAKLPARFVLGALAGIRLFAVFGDDWAAMAQARRARGLGDSGAIRRACTMAFALLVLAIRRGGTLATAMEARGFGSNARTWARPATLGWRDAVVMGVAILVGVGALVTAILLGTYSLLGTGNA